MQRAGHLVHPAGSDKRGERGYILKHITIICLFLVAFYGCGATSYNTSYETDEIIVGVGVAVFSTIVIYAMLASLEEEAYQKSRKAREQLNDLLNTWIGRYVSDMILRLGPANEITTDGKGGNIYIWSFSRTKLIALGTTDTTGIVKEIFGDHYFKAKTTRTPARYKTYQLKLMFWVNQDGIIYHWMQK